MRQGVGTLLFQDSTQRARAHGAVRMEWDSEHRAVAFYERMGARWIRDSEPNPYGIVFPVMGISLASSA
jgi:hypothetical protein